MYGIFTSFKEEIIRKGLVPEKNLPYFMMWVKKYFESCCKSEAEFSDFLSEQGREDWQIRQALDAVRLYREFSGGLNGEERFYGNPLQALERMLKVRHYSPRTVKVYLYWSRDFLGYCREFDIDNKADSSFRDYLTMLALKRKVAASTQNQAFNALLFLFRNLWGREPSDIDAVRARKPRRLPVVLSQEEVSRVLSHVKGIPGIVIKLCYSSGLRLSEALSLRVKDVSLEPGSITVRGGKGNKDRVTVLASRMIPVLREHLTVLKKRQEAALYKVSLPGAISKKYPAAGNSWKWWYLFPSTNICSFEGNRVIHHIHPSTVQNEMRRAVLSSGISKRAGVHTLRHCFVTHLLMSCVDLCEIQELMGHKSLETTRIYLHVVKSLRNSVQSPLDKIPCL